MAAMGAGEKQILAHGAQARERAATFWDGPL